MFATMTAGSALLMWIGEQITEKGVGNGISIVLLFNIFPAFLRISGTCTTGFLSGTEVPVMAIGFYHCCGDCSHGCLCNRLNDAERNIPVQYSKKWWAASWWADRRPAFPLKGEYRRCYPGYLCLLHHVLPGSDCPVLFCGLYYLRAAKS